MTSMVDWALKKITYLFSSHLLMSKNSRGDWEEVKEFFLPNSHVNHMSIAFSCCVSGVYAVVDLYGLCAQVSITGGSVVRAPDTQVVVTTAADTTEQSSSPSALKTGWGIGSLAPSLLVKLGFLKHGCRHEVTELHCPASRIVPDTVEWFLH